jgi:hypothetical protein
MSPIFSGVFTCLLGFFFSVFALEDYAQEPAGYQNHSYDHESFGHADHADHEKRGKERAGDAADGGYGIDVARGGADFMAFRRQHFYQYRNCHANKNTGNKKEDN